MLSIRQATHPAATAAIERLPTRDQAAQGPPPAAPEQQDAKHPAQSFSASPPPAQAAADKGPSQASKAVPAAPAAPEPPQALVDRLPLASPAGVSDRWRLSLLQPQAGATTTEPFGGPLLITQHLARGGYGKVHVGLDEGGRPLAIKQLRLQERMPIDAARGKVAAVGYTKRSLLERELAFIALPCTEMRLHGVLFTADHRAFVATDLAAGSLADFIDSAQHLYGAHRRSPSVVREQANVLSGIALRAVEQTSRQLQALAAQEIAHHDIKPDNLLLTRTSPVEFKLWDFGLARSKPDAGSFPPYGGGTLEYLSPERLMGRPYEFSTDSHALGCVAVEILVNRFAFDVRSSAWPQQVDDATRLISLHQEFTQWHATKHWVGSPAPLHAQPWSASETFRQGFVETYELMDERFPHLADFVYGILMNPDPSKRGTHAENALLAKKLREMTDVGAGADVALTMFASKPTALTEATEVLAAARAQMLPEGGRGVDPLYILDRRPKQKAASHGGLSEDGSFDASAAFLI